MKSFENIFKTVLEQDEAPAADANVSDKEAANQVLGQGTSVDQLGAQAGSDAVADAKRASTQQQLSELRSWVTEIEKFIEYLNGVNDNSVQSKLHKASCDSMYEKIARSETKKIARVAVDLSSLAESLKGYLIAGANEKV
jgi:hypothetical protein